MYRTSAGYKVWITSEDGKAVFGDGKWRLLQAIQKTGSLKKAVEELNISYRKAWGDLKKAQQALGVTLFEKHRGGVSGGGTELTKEGSELVAAYGAFKEECDRSIKEIHSKHLSQIMVGGLKGIDS